MALSVSAAQHRRQRVDNRVKIAAAGRIVAVLGVWTGAQRGGGGVEEEDWQAAGAARCLCLQSRVCRPSR